MDSKRNEEGDKKLSNSKKNKKWIFKGSIFIFLVVRD